MTENATPDLIGPKEMLELLKARDHALLGPNVTVGDQN